MLNGSSKLLNNSNHKKIDLSPHFKCWEFECHCCDKLVIAPVLVDCLEELRELVKVPIHISSGYRCIMQNLKVGGSASSFHVKGMAADIKIEGLDNVAMCLEAEKIKAFYNGGIGIYSNFIHVDIRPYAARWGRVHGQYLNYNDAMEIFNPEGKK